MGNSKNDYEKHLEAWELHFAALDGGSGDGRWTELTAKELCKLLAEKTLGLNGGPTHQMNEAAKKIGFGWDNVTFVAPGVAHVLTMIEFVDTEKVEAPVEADVEAA